jgi:hypothetical protein
LQTYRHVLRHRLAPQLVKLQQTEASPSNPAKYTSLTSGNRQIPSPKLRSPPQSCTLPRPNLRQHFPDEIWASCLLDLFRARRQPAPTPRTQRNTSVHDLADHTCTPVDRHLSSPPTPQNTPPQLQSSHGAPDHSFRHAFYIMPRAVFSSRHFLHHTDGNGNRRSMEVWKCIGARSSRWGPRGQRHFALAFLSGKASLGQGDGLFWETAVTGT